MKKYIDVEKVKEIVNSEAAFYIGAGDEHVKEVVHKILLRIAKEGKENNIGILDEDFVKDNVLQWHNDPADFPGDKLGVIAEYTTTTCEIGERMLGMLFFDKEGWHEENDKYDNVTVASVIRWAYIPGTRAAWGKR